MEIILDKIDSVKRCIQRINEEYRGIDDNLKNITKQDSIVLNLQRACELSIDIANYVISKYEFETPKISRESFEILCKHKIITEQISENLQKMVGFRNIAVHNYKKISLIILSEIILVNLNDFETFCEQTLNSLKA
ncbi:MAG TPA: DUF86 domain-containing protein [bacterium]|nr:DUF86 domain-containing protein [bacterium]HPS29936.1 DUF86 domain-containing protein [bacterium]